MSNKPANSWVTQDTHLVGNVGLPIPPVYVWLYELSSPYSSYWAWVNISMTYLNSSMSTQLGCFLALYYNNCISCAIILHLHVERFNINPLTLSCSLYSCDLVAPGQWLLFDGFIIQVYDVGMEINDVTVALRLYQIIRQKWWHISGIPVMIWSEWTSVWSERFKFLFVYQIGSDLWLCWQHFLPEM